jgi:hypothetical protein
MDRDITADQKEEIGEKLNIKRVTFFFPPNDQKSKFYIMILSNTCPT